jgi:hypothetical protein
VLATMCWPLLARHGQHKAPTRGVSGEETEMAAVSDTVHTQAIARHRDVRRFWRILIAVTLPIGPLGVTVARAVMPYWTSDDSATIVEKLLANPDTVVAMQWIGLVMMAPLLGATLSLGYVSRRGAPMLATVGSLMSFAVYAVWGVTGNIELSVYAMGDAGVDPATILQVVEVQEGTAVALLAGFGWVVGHIVGMILLGLAVWKAKVVPMWVGMGLAVSQPIHLVSAIILPSRLLDVTLGWGLTTVCCVAVGITVLRMRDDDFDLPPLARKAAG